MWISSVETEDIELPEKFLRDTGETPCGIWRSAEPGDAEGAEMRHRLGRETRKEGVGQGGQEEGQFDKWRKGCRKGEDQGRRAADDDEAL
jgi:hypothetical protein